MYQTKILQKVLIIDVFTLEKTIKNLTQLNVGKSKFS